MSCKDIGLRINVYIAPKTDGRYQRIQGLTDEAIEYALNTPKTTLRRWAERQGYEWRTWSMDHPFRFKKIYGEKQDAGQAE